MAQRKSAGKVTKDSHARAKRSDSGKNDEAAIQLVHGAYAVIPTNRQENVISIVKQGNMHYCTKKYCDYKHTLANQVVTHLQMKHIDLSVYPNDYDSSRAYVPRSLRRTAITVDNGTLLAVCGASSTPLLRDQIVEHIYQCAACRGNGFEWSKFLMSDLRRVCNTKVMLDGVMEMRETLCGIYGLDLRRSCTTCSGKPCAVIRPHMPNVETTDLKSIHIGLKEDTLIAHWNSMAPPIGVRVLDLEPGSVYQPAHPGVVTKESILKVVYDEGWKFLDKCTDGLHRVIVSRFEIDEIHDSGDHSERYSFVSDKDNGFNKLPYPMDYAIEVEKVTIGFDKTSFDMQFVEQCRKLQDLISLLLLMSVRQTSMDHVFGAKLFATPGSKRRTLMYKNKRMVLQFLPIAKPVAELLFRYLLFVRPQMERAYEHLGISEESQWLQLGMIFSFGYDKNSKKRLDHSLQETLSIYYGDHAIESLSGYMMLNNGLSVDCECLDERLAKEGEHVLP